MGRGASGKTGLGSFRYWGSLLTLAALGAGHEASRAPSLPSPNPGPPAAPTGDNPPIAADSVPAPVRAPGASDPLGDGANHVAPGLPLIADQRIEPIDLPGALRLAGARDLDIAIARERVCQALAELERARVLWLPSLYLGPNWIRHDGQAQLVNGPVQSISKSSLFLGATAAGGSSVTGPVPAGGPAPVGGLTSILRISDAIFEPLAARQLVAARRAGIQSVANDALLGAAEAYLDLQQAAGRLAIAREAAANAETLARLTASYARSGAGLEADRRRSLTEWDHRRRLIEEAVGELEVASAELVRRVRLDPRVVVAPVEPPESVLRLVPDGAPIDDLIAAGLRNRPELTEAQALVQATLARLRQARMRPFIPSLAFRFSGGGFGGGPNGFFGNFNARSDTDVNLYWEVQNLGFADRAAARSRAAQQRTAVLELLKVQDRVASEVVRADKARLAAGRQMALAALAVPEAIDSLALNLANIRRGAGLPNATRPIEVLQPIQALAQARTEYLDAVLAYNRAQFRLFHALGQPPWIGQAPAAPSPGPGTIAPGHAPAAPRLR